MENADALRKTAERYRRMAARMDDPQAVAALLELAEKYDAIAVEQKGNAAWLDKD